MHARQRSRRRLDVDDAVARDVGLRDALDGEDRAVCTCSNTSIICFSAGGVASMMSSPRTTANGSSPTRFLRHEHGVAEAERLALAHVATVDQVRDLADLLELLVLAARSRNASSSDETSK